MADQIRFSDYHSVDFDTCLALFQSNCPDYFAPEEQSDFTAFLLDLPGPYLLMHHETLGIVGCGGYAFNQSDHSADLCWGIIHADFHRRGFGKALLTERIKRIKLNPAITHIRLHTIKKTESFFADYNFITLENPKEALLRIADGIFMQRQLQ